MPVTLSHEIFGSGEPLVILHGLFGSKRNWLSMAKQLAEFSRVIAVDLRNHGDSDHAASMRFEEMAEDVVYLLNRLHIADANILGHSLGGKVAMMCALNHADRTKRLLVLDVAPVRYQSGFDRYTGAMRALPLAELRSRSDADTQLAKSIPDLRVRQFLLHNLVRGNEGFRWRLNLDSIAENLADIADFPAIDEGLVYRGPALFVAGEESDYLLAHYRADILALFPAARFETVADAGHWIHADQPEAVVKLVRRELAGSVPA